VESQVTVAEWESDVTNPRYGQPKYYNINFAPLETSGTSAEPTPSITKVHWSRVLHVADNRETSEIFGTPRQKPVYNRLCDLRKVAGGSAEMFWRGALPGYSFEIDPNTASDVELDSDALRKEFESFSNGLQRYMALMGVQAKSLAPQVADPESQVRVQIQLICISIGCPMRVFMGTEEGKLAGSQDSKAWNDRIDERRFEYIEPFLIRPLIDRLI